MKNRIWTFMLALTLLSACGGEGHPTPEAPEPPPMVRQELLFLQQGFRQHGVEGTYTVYFAPAGEERELLLEDPEGLFWRESYTCTWDEERDWYTFSNLFEPVLTQNPDWNRTGEADEETASFQAAAVYTAELSADMDLNTPLRFDVPPGPVVYDRQWGGGKEAPDRLHWQLYLYQNPRLGFRAEIEYPQYGSWLKDFPHREKVNGRIREAFFYGYHEEALRPEWEMRGEIIRNGVVTRADRGLLSLRIYASSCFMTAAHPNDWYAGLTMDLETGEALALRDILGPDRTVEDLLDSGAFHCKQIWDESLDRDEAEGLQIEEAKTFLDPDSTENFYLTEDSLGLIGSLGRYSFYMEAPFSALGLEAWMA
ncbi:MAG: hypothetical protein HFF97_07740 [Oscillibacter sp.]|nr:hypothetical protein [uncultured Oscillibacter sp.]MCI9644600.1 hypothetical protein [Oscillibacter sp.]